MPAFRVIADCIYVRPPWAGFEMLEKGGSFLPRYVSCVYVELITVVSTFDRGVDIMLW